MASQSTFIQQSRSGPVQPKERIEIIDILRGFALLGILLVNMDLFINPVETAVFPPDPGKPFIDKITYWFIRFLAEGKFYSLFSLLFGLGFAIQMDRAAEKSVKFGGVYFRRILILLLFGFIHAFYIWVGDILMLYAVTGLILLLFRKAKPKTLIVWSIILFSIPVLMQSSGVVAVELGRMDPDAAAEIEKSLATQDSTYRANIAAGYEVYPHGNFTEITAQRRKDMKFMGFVSIILLPNVLAMFLIGLYFGKRKLLHNASENLALFRKLLRWAIFAGIPMNILFATLKISVSPIEPTPMVVLMITAMVVGAPLLCLGYVSMIVFLVQKQPGLNLLNKLAPVGRLALTNYLGQSIACTLIFYGYGLGFFGQVGTTVGLLLTVAIFLTQVALSNWWVKRFRFGPAEWLWRSLTYWKLQPMKLSSAQN